MICIEAGINSINGEIKIPGDKSISHRAAMVGAISFGDTEINNFLMGEDCLSTIRSLEDCGVEFETAGSIILVHGRGLRGLKKPGRILDAGNSGTTIRLLSGILCGQGFESSITGDGSIRRRPMRRVIEPLRLMNARITGEKDEFAPLHILPSNLKGIEYAMPVDSAQVKSAILFASLYADGPTVIIENNPSRNHTEIMLSNFGACIDIDGNMIKSYPADSLKAQNITVPGDISSAAFFIVAAIVSKKSCVRIKSVNINPTRAGVLEVLISMGADILVENKRMVSGEPVADITARSSSLKGVEIQPGMIPRLIDEIPVICAAAVFADGVTRITGAGELKYKESNRIDTCVYNLRSLGADIDGTDDGIIIRGGKKIHGGIVKGFSDHRVVMAMAAAGFGIEESIFIDGEQSASISFPGFFRIMEMLAGHV